MVAPHFFGRAVPQSYGEAGWEIGRRRRNDSPYESQHLEAPPTPLRQLVPDVPADLESLVLELLAKRPMDRPDTAWAVYDRLVPFCLRLNLLPMTRNPRLGPYPIRPGPTGARVRHGHVPPVLPRPSRRATPRSSRRRSTTLLHKSKSWSITKGSRRPQTCWPS
jgi:hypothetical protein